MSAMLVEMNKSAVFRSLVGFAGAGTLSSMVRRQWLCCSHTFSMSSVDTSQPNPVLKQILTDIEFRGGRKSAIFLQICKGAEGFYGAKGSNLRRLYQQAVDRINRKKSSTYKELVEECGIAPSAATIQESMEELRTAMAKATLTTPAEKEEQEKKVTIAEKPMARSKTPPPPPPQPTLSFTPPPSPGLFHQAIASPGLSVTSATETSSGDFASLLDSTTGWTADNPHIIPVVKGNTSLPHGFNGMFSDSVPIGAFERDVYYVTKAIGGDLAKWKATLPDEGDFPEYSGRCVLVEGPGSDYIHTDPQVLTDSLSETLKLQKNEIPNNVADGFKRAFKKLANFLRRGTSRATQYYLFVYPPHTVFDNTAISGEGAAESVKTFGIRVNTKFSIFTKNNHSNIVCFWAIATEAEESRRMDTFTSQIASDLFDF